MNVHHLTAALLRHRIVNDATADVSHITTDSRQVTPGSLFIAIRGYQTDGHDFVERSVAKGAVAIVVEEHVQTVSVPQIVVPDTLLASAILASVFYGHPSRGMRMVGVTGTNGKSTVAHLIEHVLRDAGFQPGVCGTLGAHIGERVIETANTTPFPIDLQSILNEMLNAGCSHGVMEVSSHALERRQTAGTEYDVAVFTNLTQDHLDFHGSMEAYRAAKGKLFARLGNAYGDTRASMPYGVLNADDAASTYLAEQTIAECVTYGIEADADVQASNVRIRADGAVFSVRTWQGESAQIQLAITGRFNVYNALAAICVGIIESIPLANIARSLEQIQGVPGRLERVRAQAPITVLVDYSHTPDSLQNALATVKEFAIGRVICVVGCGGDRDKGKRPIMARIACEWSDLVILTSDNPRTEDPEQILNDMEDGVRSGGFEYRRIRDRGEAIDCAVRVAQPDDVILIAGKGHETYQIIGRTKHPFDDREVAATAIHQRFS